MLTTGMVINLSKNLAA